MTQILVAASALRTSGALTIYKQFLDHLMGVVSIPGWECVEWTVVVDDDMPVAELPHVEFVRLSTRRWIDRLRFDYRGLSHVVSKPDLVISLQNTGIPFYAGIPQIVYYHQSLPFFARRWNPMKAEERTLWCYKHVYPLFVQRSLTQLTDVVVQIPSVASAFAQRYRVPHDRLHIFFPDVEDVDSGNVKPMPLDEGLVYFIYPAAPLKYKEHQTLVQALRLVAQRDPMMVCRIRILFTFATGAAPWLEQSIAQSGLQQQFVLLGVLQHDQLLRYYKSAAALLFPSTIETLGLPMLEAAAFGLPVLASDTGFGHDVIGDYGGSQFLPAYDYDRWADAIISLSDSCQRFESYHRCERSSWSDFFSLVKSRL